VYLLAVDTTPYERKYAPKLADKTYVFKPNTVKGKPITIGHSYSHTVLVPYEGKEQPPWVIPLDVKRVQSNELGHVVGMQQISDLLNDTSLPFQNNLTVAVCDCAYSCEESLQTVSDQLHKNLVLMVRLRGNRIAYKKIHDKSLQAGHPKWYGGEICLNNPHRQISPDIKFEIEERNSRGKRIINQVSIWQNTVFHGSKIFRSYNYPFTLIQIKSYFEDGRLVFKNPLCIGIYGKRRDEFLPMFQALIYKERFKIEHFFRFCKQNQLMNKFQTPDVKHEEAWNKLQMLAYLQLFAAKDLAEEQVHPWEQYLSKKKGCVALSPKKVQRGFSHLLKQIPRFVPDLIPRGNPQGRPLGYRMPEREDRKVIIKKAKEKTTRPMPTDPLPLEFLFDKSLSRDKNNKLPAFVTKKINRESGKSAQKSQLDNYYQPSLFREFDQQIFVQNKSPPP